MKRKYRWLFTPKRRRKPGPKGPGPELATAIVEMKRRNPRFGCRRIAQQIALLFGIEIDKYAASLGVEMGLYSDPYDRYGHLLLQSMLATRLVVDTGMNYFDWPLEKARAYMKEHTFESDVQIASETLRYSTDLFAQALDYRLGYDQFWQLRRAAESKLGERFDIRRFHVAAVGDGAMPLDVLAEKIEQFIAGQQGGVTP